MVASYGDAPRRGGVEFSVTWITAFTVVSLVANIVFLIGCITPPTKDIALYRVNIAFAGESLKDLAAIDSPGQTQPLGYDVLPTYWYWGMSGICDVFEVTGETRCRRAFPPTQNLLTIIQQSLDGNKDKKQSKDIIDSWKTTLDKINDNRLREKEGTLEMESKASAALAIIAIILDIITPIVAVSLRRASKPSLPYLLPLLSGLIAGAAGVLAVMSMKSGIHDLANNGEHGGAAIIILFVGAALRILSCGGAARTPSAAAAAQGRLQPPPGVPRNDWIGFLGENYIYALFGSHLPGWSYENWTSHLRKYAHFPEFLLPQSQYSDFTYTDPSGFMPGFLSSMGVPVSPHWSDSTKYHIEVKATPGHCGAEFYVSHYQVQKMQEYTGDPNNAYVLTRVFNLGGSPDLRCFLDPRSHPDLVWGQPNSDGDYPVRTKY